MAQQITSFELRSAEITAETPNRLQCSHRCNAFWRLSWPACSSFGFIRRTEGNGLDQPRFRGNVSRAAFVCRILVKADLESRKLNDPPLPSEPSRWNSGLRSIRSSQPCCERTLSLVRIPCLAAGTERRSF